MTSLPKTFRLYLKNQGASSFTIKNYLSDFNHFWGWLILTLRAELVPFDENNPQTVVSQISPQIVGRYKSFLLSNDNSISTVNRRLSTLRQFGKFCISQAWIQTNPAKKVANATLADKEKSKVDNEQILGEFKKHLEKERVSSITIKNYLSDIRHFLFWIEGQVA